jgi:hypothetical protein
VYAISMYVCMLYVCMLYVCMLYVCMSVCMYVCNISFLFPEPVISLITGLTVASAEELGYICWKIWKLEFFQQCSHTEM